MTVDDSVTQNAGSLNLVGIVLQPFTIDSLHASIKSSVEQGAHHRYMNVNMNALDICFRDPNFKQILVDAEYVFCDGHGVMLAARLFGYRIPQKITYAHWLPLLSEFCADNTISIYFLGGKPGVAEVAAENMLAHAPGLDVVGARDGYFTKTPGSSENQDVIASINAANPDILLVCFGMPAQERWIHENWSLLNVRVVLPAGAAIDYAAGVSTRPPRWLTDHGLEWLGRLLQDPRRLFYRYMVRMPLVFFKLIWLRLRGSKDIPCQGQAS